MLTATSSASLRTVEAGGLTLQGLYGSRKKAIPTASFGTVFNDPRTHTVEKRGTSIFSTSGPSQQVGARFTALLRRLWLRR